MRPLALLLGFVVASASASALEPIPDKLVVLTFDDSSRSHFTVARPLLQKHKFGATFFVTEGWDFATNKKDYLTWEQIAQLHKDGFEIGNHTRDHASVTEKSLRDLSAQLKGIEDRCNEHGIPKPTSFAYPGNAIHKDALAILKDRGIRFARRGGSPEYAYKDGQGIAYEPNLDHPLLVPTTGDARPTWTLDDLKKTVAMAKHGRIAVLQFHGVPDTAHDWVSVKERQFETFLKFLADEKCTVIAMRDLAKYVDADVAPNDPWGAIEDRKARVAAGKPLDDSRTAKSDDDLRSWLTNALVHHRFTAAETGAALRLTAEEVTAAAKRLAIDTKEARPSILPYPGGRHPRIGFRDGMIRPQRETKASVFAPWPDGGYAVADTPEAVWFEPTPKKPELLYLAHAHIPTHWDRKKIEIEPLEWTRKADGSLELDRTLPNKVVLSSRVVPGKDGVRMEFRVTNGSPEKLTGLRVQMCVMLAGLKGFEERTNANKVFEPPFAACKDTGGSKWIVTGWERCGRAWGNPPCPCLHADPVVEDCPPGESRRVRGWISFYTGADVRDELKRVKAIAFPAE
jgi:peptidoglycan/xylan/chitin deacetylase (PgdA/CDA1 family)